MSVRTATTKEKPLVIYSRVGEAGVPKIFHFRNADGTPHDISGYDFEYILKSKPGNGDDVFKLTVGNGLTVQGTGNADLKLDISNDNANIRPMTYFGRLYASAEDHTWLNNDHVFHDGKFDGIDDPEEGITIYQNGGEVIIEISGEGITQAEMDAAIEAANELRISTQTSTATLTPSPSYDCFELTAQEEALTIDNPSTDYGNFEIFTVTVTDDGNAQDIIFGDKFRPFGQPLPTETTAGKTMDIVCRYNATADKYDVKWSEEV